MKTKRAINRNRNRNRNRNSYKIKIKKSLLKKKIGGGLVLKRKTLRDKGKCAPHNNDNNFSCFPKKSLLNICNSWNKHYQDDKIIYSSNNTLGQLWNKLDEKLKKSCNNEWCWIEQEFVKGLSNDNVKDLFRPQMPKKWYDYEKEWLTTTDIENVMKQYEKKYDNFKFIGPVPMDFDYKPHPGQCIVNELCNINMSRLYNKGITKLGIVFNLDAHDKPGSHWVALFSDVNKGGVYYFDSYGLEPPKEVKVLMNKLTKQGKSFNSGMRKYSNNIRHQYKNSECGVYSMHFIIKLLEGSSFKHITENIIKDDDMLKNREVFYLKE